MEVENLRNLQKDTTSEETSAGTELEAATKETHRNKMECDAKVKVSKSFPAVLPDVSDLQAVIVNVVVVPQTVRLNNPESQ